jgi:hypothetical protein
LKEDVDACDVCAKTRFALLRGHDGVLRHRLEPEIVFRQEDALVPRIRFRARRRKGGGLYAAADAGGKILGVQERAGILYEAMECLGGNGYVEEGILARHYRESPVNAIWEGSGNVMCLDVLRALSREADAARSVLQSLIEQTAGLPGAAETAAFIGSTFRRADSERVARSAVEKLAMLAAAAALNGVSPRSAELFAATRWPRITLACTAPSISPARTYAACWSGHCPGKDVVMPGLVPGIHVCSVRDKARRGWPGQARP